MNWLSLIQDLCKEGEGEAIFDLGVVPIACSFYGLFDLQIFLTRGTLILVSSCSFCPQKPAWRCSEQMYYIGFL